MLTITGGLVFLQKGEQSPFGSLVETLDTTNTPYERLDAEEVKKRWPQFDVPDSVEAIYTADTGITHAAKTVSAMQSLARSNGALLYENTPVERVVPLSSSGVEVWTPNGRFRASKAILATDAWTNKLLAPLGLYIPLSVMQEQVTYFKPTDPPAFEPEKFPVWIWAGDPGFYGFPSFGEPTIKAGRDTSNNFMTPDQRTYVHSPQLFEQLSSFMGSFIPGKGLPLRTVTCQYCITPDRQFIITPLESHPDIILGLGASHAFKFAPAFGRVLAELAVDGRATEDISKFGMPKTAVSRSML